MIKETEALGFYPMDKNGIDSLIDTSMRCFTHTLVKLYDEEFRKLPNDLQTKFKDLKSFLNDSNSSLTIPQQICSLYNYEYFSHKYPCRRINFNTKDLHYSELILDTWSLFKISLNNIICQRKENKIKDDYLYQGATDLVEPEIYSPDNYQAYFGLGEFPYIRVNIARIGNLDYSWYELAR